MGQILRMLDGNQDGISFFFRVEGHVSNEKNKRGLIPTYLTEFRGLK